MHALGIISPVVHTTQSFLSSTYEAYSEPDINTVFALYCDCVKMENTKIIRNQGSIDRTALRKSGENIRTRFAFFALKRVLI